VPTFGKIFKIIDFGRAIYQFKGKRICSNSFKSKNDAAMQYNTEPYFNAKRPRLDPNPSFDLCRLACSLFDYIEESVDPKNIKKSVPNKPYVGIIVDWCLDDKGKHMLFKKNGEERYPQFKLYKMISRFVHNHTPKNQLQRPEFQKFKCSLDNKAKQSVMVIDTLERFQ
jgi:hypothetical protein